MSRHSHTDDLFAFGERVRTLREQRGMRQGELAAAAGISQSQLSRIEKGQASEPAYSLVRRLERELHCTNGELAGLLEETV
ncbi:MAG: XRE family transcriptional regulator [Chloroflexi bacterium]|nr:MAG: XRE family transcriptional regulator [Chloroflexota bacterium]